MALAPTPTRTTLLAQPGRYDAFPVAATHPDGSVLTLWRSGTDHARDKGATIKGASSPDGKTWGAVFTAYDDQDPLVTHSPTGLVWNADVGKWQCLLLVMTYPSTSSTTPTYSMRLMESVDGRAWVLRPVIAKPAGVVWWFASHMVITPAGVLVGTAYGSNTGGSSWVAFVIVSTDNGATWTLSQTLAKADLNLAEPQISPAANGEWVMTIRCDTDWTIYQSRCVDPGAGAWSEPSPSLTGYSGQPSVAVTRDASGTMVLLLRQLPEITNTHGLWAYATSADHGLTWDVREFAPDTTRFMLYGALAPLPNGNVTVVFSSEDDPAQPWVSASMYAARFVVQRLTVNLDFTHDAPGVAVQVNTLSDVERTWVDVFGETVTETVRVKWWDGETLTALDTEIQQGRTYTYRAAGLSAYPVAAPTLPETVLVHPLWPEWSLPAMVVEDSERGYGIDASVTQIPDRGFPIVTTSGTRNGAAGQTVIRTSTLVQKAHLLRLLSDGCPLFWSHHEGLDLPEWVSVLDVKETRFVQMCSHNLDDPDSAGQWRHWSLSWVEVERPDPAALFPHRRYKDYPLPYSALPIPYQEL